MAAPKETSSRTQYLWPIFTVLVIFVYFFGLNVPLLGPDEPRYAQVAREMFERGDWITTTLGGFQWFEKPALLYWYQIAAYHVFGVNEFAARFGSALSGLGTILSLWMLARFSGLPNALNSPNFPNRLALIAAASVGLIVFSRGASFDIILTFPITAAMSAFFISDSRERAGKSSLLPLIIFYIFVGVSLLAKGLVGIVFPFAIVGFYFVLMRRIPSAKFLFSVVWGTLLAAVVAAAWYLPMYLVNGWEFIDEFFIQHHFQRYTSNKYLHPQPFYFFFFVLPLMTLPWLPFFVAKLWQMLRRLFSKRNTEDAELKFSPAEVFAFAWLAVPLVFFSFSGSKLPGYILPALPPCLMLAAMCVDKFIGENLRRVALIRAAAVATLVIVVGLVIFALPRYAETDSVKSLIAAAAEKGFANEKVAGLHTVSHNAEFYAAGRLIREPDGKQRRFDGTFEILEQMQKTGEQSILILVPSEKLADALLQKNLRLELIKDNGETAILICTTGAPSIPTGAASIPACQRPTDAKNSPLLRTFSGIRR